MPKTERCAGRGEGRREEERERERGVEGRWENSFALRWVSLSGQTRNKMILYMESNNK